MKKPRENIVKQPSGMYLMPRDREILHTIYQYDGVMTFRQIAVLFFKGGERTAYGRILLLLKFNYLDQPIMRERMSLKERIYWLKPAGVKIAAEEEGVTVQELLKGLKKPRTDRLPHLIPLNNFRAKLQLEVKYHPDLQFVGRWIGQVPFAQHTDQVEYRDASGKLSKRYIEPDGFFIIENTRSQRTLRALLELDRGTKDNPKMVNEKALPVISYIASELFALRTGYNSGRMLFVVQSEDSMARLRNLKGAIERATKQNAENFWFTTYEAAMSAQSIIFDPIWYRGKPRPALRPGEGESKISEEGFEPLALML